MKKELSAGGIVIRKQNNEWFVLLMQDMNSFWTFAKGRIEPGESAKDAAIREIKEETGVGNLQYITELKSIHYVYHRNGLIDKTVKYFLFKTSFDGSLRPQYEEGIHAAKWVPTEQAVSMLGYTDTNVEILRSVINKLQSKKFASL